MTARIATIGDLTVDLVMPVALPIQPGQSLEVPWHRVEPGGAGNFLIAGQRLGAQMYAVGALGGDLYGQEALTILSAEGINVTGVTAQPETTTTVVIVLMEPDTGRFAYIWRGGQGPLIELSAAAKSNIDQADALFLQGYTLCEEQLHPLVDYALASDRALYFDIGPAISGAAEAERARARRRAQAILTTEDELPQITEGRIGQAAYDFLLSEGPRLVVIKRGAQGCRVITESGDCFDIPAFPATVRDLVGAGDCFNAAFIYGCLRGLSPQQAALLANAAGAAKVQKLGTGRAVPTRAEVEAILQANGQPILL